MAERSYDGGVCSCVPLHFSLLTWPWDSPGTSLSACLQVTNSRLKICYVLIMPDKVLLMSGKLLLMSFVQGSDQPDNLIVDCLTYLSLHVLTEAVKQFFYGARSRGSSRSERVRSLWKRARA